MASQRCLILVAAARVSPSSQSACSCAGTTPPGIRDDTKSTVDIMRMSLVQKGDSNTYLGLLDTTGQAHPPRQHMPIILKEGIKNSLGDIIRVAVPTAPRLRLMRLQGEFNAASSVTRFCPQPKL